MYFCLNWDRYETGRVRRRRDGKLVGGSHSPDSVRGSPEVLSTVEWSVDAVNRRRLAIARESEVASTERAVKESRSSSSEMRRTAYACFSQRFFQVISSLSSSRQRRDTCDARARVLGSSIKDRTCKLGWNIGQHRSCFQRKVGSTNVLLSSTTHLETPERDLFVTWGRRSSRRSSAVGCHIHPRCPRGVSACGRWTKC